MDLKGNGFFTGKTVLDCFAGSGSFGLEALSRGADHAFFADADKEAVSLLHANAKKLKVEKFSTVIRGDAAFLKNREKYCSKSCDVVFLDPPYGKVPMDSILKCLFRGGWITADTLVITEENAPKTKFPPAGLPEKSPHDGYEEITSKIWGNSIFRILRPT
jgi:16S rRNA (guanine966-N2)-methyltransferase